MAFDLSTKAKLVSIEQSIDQYGYRHAAYQFEDFYKTYNKGDIDLDDQVLNLRLQILIGQGEFSELERVLELEKGISSETQIRYLLAKGILSNRKQAFRESLLYFLDAESKAKTDERTKLFAQIQINIGTVYAGLHHYQEGLDRYSNVLENYSNIISESTKAALLHNLGNLNYAAGHIVESIRCLEASISLNVIALTGHSRLLLMRSQLVESGRTEVTFDEVSNMEDLKPIKLYCQSYYETGHQRLEILGKVIDAAREIKDNRSELDALRDVIEIYKAESDWQKAFAAIENYRAVEQRITEIQQTARLAEQAARYDLAEKEKSIIVLRKEKELQDEIVKRNDLLEAVNEEMRQFAYVVSHDLKEPLRMIGAYTQLIQMSVKDNIHEENEEYFDFVSGGVARLNVLLDGLSNYSTLKSLQEEYEPQSLKDLIQTATINLDVLIEETNTSIEVAEDLKINGGSTLLVLLFQNLIQNAIKFRRDENPPVIKIRVTKTPKKSIIEVSDNGVGIAQKQRDRVFVIFQRLSRDHAEGSGMGLAICKKIVQLHEGRIYVKESKEGEGTTFCIELPN